MVSENNGCTCFRKVSRLVYIYIIPTSTTHDRRRKIIVQKFRARAAIFSAKPPSAVRGDVGGRTTTGGAVRSASVAFQHKNWIFIAAARREAEHDAILYDLSRRVRAALRRRAKARRLIEVNR